MQIAKTPGAGRNFLDSSSSLKSSKIPAPWICAFISYCFGLFVLSNKSTNLEYLQSIVIGYSIHISFLIFLTSDI